MRTRTQSASAVLIFGMLLAACSTPAAQSQSLSPTASPSAAESAASSAEASAPAEPTPAPDLGTVRLGVPSLSFAWAPALVAMGNGYFEEEGLTVEQVEVQAGPGAYAAANSDQIDIGFGVMTDLAQAASSGLTPKPVAFAQILSNRLTQAVVHESWLTEHDIDVSGPIDDRIAGLTGARLGVTEVGSGGDKNMRAVLASAGVDPDTETEITAFGSVDGVLAAFLADRIDGFFLSVPTTTLATERGDGVILIDFTAGDWPPAQDTTYTGLFANEEFIADHPDVVAAATRALEKGVRFFRDDPEAAAEVLREYFPDMEQSAFDAALPAVESALPETVAFNEEGFLRAVELESGAGGDASFDEFGTNQFADDALEALADWTP